MAIAKWQQFDEKHSHCSVCCMLFLNEDLRAGICAGCRIKDKDRRREQLERADQRALSRASRELLAHMQGQGKEGASMPVVIESFFAKIGGKQRLGEIFAEQFQKCIGDGLTEAELLEFEPSPKLALSWAELISRITSKADEGKTLDVTGVSSEDLTALLSQLLEDLIRTTPDFRQMAIKLALESEPGLIDFALECSKGVVNGQAVVVSAPKESLPKPPEDDYRPELEESVE